MRKWSFFVGKDTMMGGQVGGGGRGQGFVLVLVENLGILYGVAFLGRTISFDQLSSVKVAFNTQISSLIFHLTGRQSLKAIIKSSCLAVTLELTKFASTTFSKPVKETV